MIPNNVFALWLRASAIVLACSLIASADEPAHFLSHGPGAKSLAMGESFTAVADDPSALYWNPAGILAQPPSVLMECATGDIGDTLDRGHGLHIFSPDSLEFMEMFISWIVEGQRNRPKI